MTTRPFQVNDLTFQIDHNNPEKKQLSVEYRTNPANATLFIIFFKRREIKRMSDGK